MKISFLVTILAGLAPFAEARGEGPGARRAPRIKLPIFVLPERDRDNWLERVFVDDSKPGKVVLTVVFRDEDHPLPVFDGLYDTFRRSVHGRVEDIEAIVYVYGNEAAMASGTPSSVRFPWTHSRAQRFDVFQPIHHAAVVPVAKFETIAGRPVIYVNTWNHLFGEKNSNPKLKAAKVGDYAVAKGSWRDAEAWCRKRRKTR